MGLLVDQWLAKLRNDGLSERSLLFRAKALAYAFSHPGKRKTVLAEFEAWVQNLRLETHP